MTDNEIIKALECMLGIRNNDIEYSIDCHGCAFDDNSICSENCSEGIAKAAFDLINRQMAEIERLKDYNSNLIDRNTALSNEVLESKAKAKIEAYKEFADKLKQHKRKMNGWDWSGAFWDSAVLVEVIDNILKEMKGEKI